MISDAYGLPTVAPLGPGLGIIAFPINTAPTKDCSIPGLPYRKAWGVQVRLKKGSEPIDAAYFLSRGPIFDEAKDTVNRVFAVFKDLVTQINANNVCTIIGDLDVRIEEPSGLPQNSNGLGYGQAARTAAYQAACNFLSRYFKTEVPGNLKTDPPILQEGRTLQEATQYEREVAKNLEDSSNNPTNDKIKRIVRDNNLDKLLILDCDAARAYASLTGETVVQCYSQDAKIGKSGHIRTIDTDKSFVDPQVVIAMPSIGNFDSNAIRRYLANQPYDFRILINLSSDIAHRAHSQFEIFNLSESNGTTISRKLNSTIDEILEILSLDKAVLHGGSQDAVRTHLQQTGRLLIAYLTGIPMDNVGSPITDPALKDNVVGEDTARLLRRITDSAMEGGALYAGVTGFGPNVFAIARNYSAVNAIQEGMFKAMREQGSVNTGGLPAIPSQIEPSISNGVVVTAAVRNEKMPVQES